MERVESTNDGVDVSAIECCPRIYEVRVRITEV